MARILKSTDICLSFTIFILYASLNIAWSLEWTNYGNTFINDVEIFSSQHSLQLNSNIRYMKKDEGNFHVYCYSSVPKSILQIWRSVQLELINAPYKFNIFPGENETEVIENYKSNSFWPQSFLFSGSASVVDFPAFSPYCVGIDTKEKYSFHLKVRTVNYWKVLWTLLGVFLFITAPDLSKNTFFHYAVGVSVGVLASVLILLYIFSKFIPQKSASYAVLVFGYSFVLYFLTLIYQYFQSIVTQYMDIVLGYCITASFLSFVICYRIGPVTNERTLNLIQWSMQALSLLLIFFSSEYREVSTALILVLLSLKFIPIQWIKWIKYLWYRCFPPKIKLLTELEYIEQGNIETKKSLEDLRKFCNSPDCKVWRVVRNLKDPIRFANFIENGSHYTDEELLEYNSIDLDDFNISDDIDYTNRNNTYID